MTVAYIPLSHAVLAPHKLRSRPNGTVEVRCPPQLPQPRQPPPSPPAPPARLLTLLPFAFCLLPFAFCLLVVSRHLSQCMYTESSVYPTGWYRVPATDRRLSHAVGIRRRTAQEILKKCRLSVDVAFEVPIGAHPAHAGAQLDCVRHAVTACLPGYKTQLTSFPPTAISLEEAAEWLRHRNLANLLHFPTTHQLAQAIEANPNSYIIARCEMAADGSTAHCVALSPVFENAYGYRTLHDGQADLSLLTTTHNLRAAGITLFVEGMLVVPLPHPVLAL